MRRHGASAPAIAAEMGDTVLRGMLQVIGDAALVRVSRTSALGRYQRGGYRIEDVADIRKLDVSVPDRVAGRTSTAWVAIAGATGVATAATGPIGFAVDIPALLANNLMAVGETATIYGFDIADEDERANAMAVLFMREEEVRRDVVSTAAVSHLSEIARHLRRGDPWAEIRDGEAGRWLRDAAVELAWYLVKRKLAGIVPGIGSLIAGGVNASFTARTCDRARRIYRERFIAEASASEAADASPNSRQLA